MKTKPNFYYEGFKLSLDNSISLQKIADMAALENEFGIACSLNILAAEEAVKANFILIKHYNPETEINDFKEIFRTHKIKHYHLKGLGAAQELQLKRLKTDFQIFDQFLAMIETMPESIKQKIQEDFSTWYEIQDWVKKYEERKVTYKKIAAWADKANNDKNNGFYVDLQNNAWITPKSITKEKYNQERKYTSVIIDFIQEIEKVFLDIKKFTIKKS